MAKKKKKVIDKEKKIKKNRHLNEKDTLTFEHEILDNNRQIARLKSRNEELEHEVEVVKRNLQQLEDDRSDVIAHLKRNLKQKIVESQELNERLYALEQLRKEEATSFRKREEELDEKYRTMENNLTTEIQLSAGKLSALEEWRVARNDLMKKFEIQEQQMAEQKINHEEQLYELEKNLIISKIKLKNEMEDRLNELAKNFRDTTNLRIADTTKQVVQENITLNRELDAMYKIYRNYNTIITAYKERDFDLKMQACVYQAEAKSTLKQMHKKNKLIKKLCDNIKEHNFMDAKIKCAEKNAKFYENLAKDYESKYLNSLEKTKGLENDIEQIKLSKNEILNNIEANSQDILKLREVINRAKECLKTVLKLNSEEDKEDMVMDDKKNKFLRTMLDILGSDLYFQTHDQIRKDILETKYSHGDLGLLCAHPVFVKNVDNKYEDEDPEHLLKENIICKNECSYLGIKNGNCEKLSTSESDYLDTPSSVESPVNNIVKSA